MPKTRQARLGPASETGVELRLHATQKPPARDTAAAEPHPSLWGGGVSAREQPKETRYEEPMEILVSALRALQVRLRLWPAKVAAPIADLLAKGLIRPETAETVLDAGDLAGESQHVLGFAVALLQMQRDNVPVIDAIRMAKQLGRPINLRWSQKRWKAEHARLSHLVTLERLKAAHEVYDLTPFEAHLPATWPGYLIRSSRRLGLEGLRQQHCVASYHGAIRRGHCAIATVFVERERWTVELRKYAHNDEPWVAQIAGRRNRKPTREIRQAIHNALGLEGRQGGRGPEDHSYMDNLRALLPILREHGVEKVTTSFSGYGDSGQVDDVEFTPAGAYTRVANATVASRRVEFSHRNNRWERNENVHIVRVVDAVTALTDDYLEETGVNYYDNEGGFGFLEIDVAAGDVELEINQNVESSELAFKRRSDIASGDVLEERMQE